MLLGLSFLRLLRRDVLPAGQITCNPSSDSGNSSDENPAVLRIFGFLAVGGNHVHRRDQLTVRIHHHVDQESIEKVAMFAATSIGIDNAEGSVTLAWMLKIIDDLLGELADRLKLMPGLHVRTLLRC